MAKLFNDISQSPDSIEKFNPYHGADGRFTTGSGATSFTYKPGQGKKYDNAIQSEKERPLREASAKTAKAAVAKAKKSEKRITDDRKKTGVIVSISRSKVIFHIANLVYDGAINMSDLEEFSDDVKTSVRMFLRMEENGH